MLAILTLADLRCELNLVHEARCSDAMSWDSYVVATDVLNTAIVSVRDLSKAEVVTTRKARIVARLDAMTIIAEVSKRQALHSGGWINRNITPEQSMTIMRCNRTLDRCQTTLIRLATI